MKCKKNANCRLSQRKRERGHFMENYTKEELEEALRAIDSTIRKCEKAQPKLKEGTSSHTLLIRRIKALQISSALIRQALEIQ